MRAPLLLWLVASIAAAWAGDDRAATEKYLRSALSNERVPGASWAIIRNREVVAVGAFGDLGGGEAVTPNTPFIVGSLTKSFTAMAVLQLVEDGKVDLDAQVVRYLPWFKVADAQATATMTVRHTLNQTTGLAWIDGLGWLASTDKGPNAIRHRVEALATVTPMAAPGTRMIYCNANYAIASAIVEAASGERFEDFVRQRIVQPLGLTQTSADVHTFAGPGFALPHRYWFWRP